MFRSWRSSVTGMKESVKRLCVRRFAYGLSQGRDRAKGLLTVDNTVFKTSYLSPNSRQLRVSSVLRNRVSFKIVIRVRFNPSGEGSGIFTIIENRRGSNNCNGVCRSLLVQCHRLGKTKVSRTATSLLGMSCRDVKLQTPWGSKNFQ